ncbi:hypothetical protein GLYMA_01G088501v4 [Glycine max]|nr:hypothetical protein GLYMA_01G088501v4 [Glycine max]KAH1162265.1 hypothetical protein GYH30_000950 [Glycine max]
MVEKMFYFPTLVSTLIDIYYSIEGLVLIKEMPTLVADGNDALTGHIISTTISGKNGEPKQTISYMAERVVGSGSFGIVFQAKCLEIGEAVTIKKACRTGNTKIMNCSLCT